MTTKLKQMAIGKALSKRLFKVAARKGVSYKTIKQHVFDRYGYESTGELTMKQYRELRELIAKLPTLPPADRVRNESPTQYAERREKGGSDEVVPA